MGMGRRFQCVIYTVFLKASSILPRVSPANPFKGMQMPVTQLWHDKGGQLQDPDMLCSLVFDLLHRSPSAFLGLGIGRSQSLANVEGSIAAPQTPQSVPVLMAGK